MALAVMGEIADEIATRFGVHPARDRPPDGEVPLGEPSVAIVACAPHRDAAFEAARYAIDETKARAPIWKAEQFSDGHVWIGDPARSSGAPAKAGGGRARTVSGFRSTGDAPLDPKCAARPRLAGRRWTRRRVADPTLDECAGVSAKTPRGGSVARRRLGNAMGGLADP